MKVIHLSTSDSGGAGRAALRIHNSLLKNNIDSEMWVNISNSNEKNIKSPKGKFRKTLAFSRRYAGKLFKLIYNTKNPILHSPAILSSSWVKKINNSNANIVNLHWVQHEMLSIADISKIKKPLVWTLHDMWAFCGAEHVSWDNRWQDGYLKNNRPSHEKGFDINRWSWRRKVQYWKNSFQIITPSNWLTECVKKSKLMSDWPSSTIPNSINLDFWCTKNKVLARNELNLSKNDIAIAFGTSRASQEYHKGFDLFYQALKKIKLQKKINLKLIVFGDTKVGKNILGFPTKFLGYLNDFELKNLYNAVDAVVVPSRQESFGQIACEASACETPVIAFDTSGLRDIIQHLETGYLAKKFDTDDLADGIEWVLKNKDIKNFGKKARQHIKNNFESSIVVKKYLDIYESYLLTRYKI
jgi:glycosyltransferase involved in cell wall biosynthesis